MRQRLGAFVAASVAVHALTFGSYRPGPDAHEHLGKPSNQAILQAALVREAVPEQPAGSEHAATDEPAQPNAATAALRATAPDSRSAESGARGVVQMPIPEHWYEAADLDRRAEPLSPVEPVYPPELAGLSAAPAKVRLRLYIDERGTVRKLKIATPGPRPEFDDAARRAWEGVRFSPAIKDGVTVKSQKLLELDFAP